MKERWNSVVTEPFTLLFSVVDSWKGQSIGIIQSHFWYVFLIQYKNFNKIPFPAQAWSSWPDGSFVTPPKCHFLNLLRSIWWLSVLVPVPRTAETISTRQNLDHRRISTIEQWDRLQESKWKSRGCSSGNRQRKNWDRREEVRYTLFLGYLSRKF